MSKFDELADSYTDVLQKNLRFIPGGVEYYTEYRAYFAHRFSPAGKETLRILDFGCGVGESLSHLLRYFPSASITACDVSSKSVDVAASRFPKVRFTNATDLEPNQFDLIFVAGVFHHIPPLERLTTLFNLSALLSKRGRICIFELNPINPVTRQLVANCEFDEDAELLTCRSLVALSKCVTDLSIVAKRFTVFFPPILGRLRLLERLLSRCPFGAQYFLVLQKNAQ